MLENVTGTLDGKRWPPKGEVVEVPDRIGAHECANGRAEPVAEVAKPEKATPRKAETRKKA